MGEERKHLFKRAGSLFLAAAMILQIMAPTSVFANEAPAETINEEPVEESQLPATIPAGTTWTLQEDLVLSSGEQIEKVEGVLDGNGHTITLADRPLVKEATGIIQNIGVKGTLKSSLGYEGSIVSTLNGGTVQNSFSLVDFDLGWSTEGGLVGKSIGGNVYNSYFAGSATEMFGMVDLGGMIGQSTTMGAASTIKNCYYTVGYPYPVALGGEYNKDDPSNKKLSVAEMTSASAEALLNTELPNTGFVWSVTPGSLPVLTAGGSTPEPGKTDKTVLNQKIEEAESLDVSLYTEETWASLQSALETAKEVTNNEAATQQEVNLVLSGLEEALAKLEKKPVLQPVGKPADDSKVVLVTEESQLRNTEAGTYYQLQNDIVSSGSYEKFHGILDGNGHTITLNGRALFQSVEKDAVIQNVHFEGTIRENEGPLGRLLNGSIVNSSSAVTGKASAGFVKRIKDGVISNCISYGKPSNGALCSVYAETDWENGGEYRGKIYSTFWLKGSADPVINQEDLLDGSTLLSEVEMKQKEIVNLLNAKKGEFGTTWGQNGTTGFPYFGEDEIYNPDQIELPDSQYTVKFGRDESSAKPIQKKRLDVSTNDLRSEDNHVIGTFYLEGVDPKNVRWSVQEVTNNAFGIAQNDGRLYLYGDGEGVVKAQVNGEDVAWIKVFSASKRIEEMEIYISDSKNSKGTKVTEDKPYEMEGSDWGKISVKVRYKGETQFQPIYAGKLSYKYGGNIHHSDGSEFYFTKPAMSSVTVTAKDDPKITKTIQLSSKFVPIESIIPAISGTNVLHSRASMMTGEQFDAIENNGVIILPENASNSHSKDYKVVSSDESIAEFSATLPVGYLPFRSGDVEFTASILDKNPLTGYEKEITGTSNASFVYRNPLTSVEMTATDFQLKTGETLPLNLKFEGELSKEGWKVTEPGMEWTFDQEGIVTIQREKLAVQNREEGSKDAGNWLASTDYELRGLRAGTVKVTGTPIDQKHEIAPIEFTVTVEQGEEVQVDIPALVKKGKDAAIHYIEEKHKTSDYQFGDEWYVYGLLRAGVKIPQDQLDTYYDSVVETVSKWNSKVKPTDVERVALALSVMGKDITNVGGKNLAEFIYNHKGLEVGSNELCYALIALDARDTEIPKNALWSREEMVAELLAWQKEDGGWPLAKNGGSGIDTTAMVLQSLANYQSDPKVAASIEKGLNYLRLEIAPLMDAKNAEANAQILLTLATVGVDPLTDKRFASEVGNTILSLMSYYKEVGEEKGFVHDKGQSQINGMATIQSLEALDAYEKYVNKEDSYWDHSSIPLEGESVDPSGPDKDKQEAQKVSDKIHRIPNPVTLEAESLITGAKKAYDKLTSEQKKLVPAEDVLKLNIALAELELLKKEEEIRPTSGQITISVERFTIGQGYHVEPIHIAYKDGESGMDVLKRAIGKENFVGYTGYLQAIKGADKGVNSVEVPSYITELSKDAPNTESTKAYYSQEGKDYFDPGVLGEKTYHPQSGWMYSVNGVFSNYGMEEYVPKDGDVMRLQYTLYGLGMDLKGKKEGSEEILANISDKTELTKVLADFNENRDNYLTDPAVKSAYEEAVRIAADMTAEQAKVDRITEVLRTALENADVPEPEGKLVVLENEDFGMSLTTRNIPETAELDIRLLTMEDPEVALMRAEVPTSNSIFRLIKVRILENGEEIPLKEDATLKIPVGKDYEGQMMEVLHCQNEKVTKETSQTNTGVVTVKVSSLDSFGVVMDAAGAAGEGGNGFESGANKGTLGQTGAGASANQAARTGDTQNVLLLAVLLMGSVSISVMEMKRRKKRG